MMYIDFLLLSRVGKKGGGHQRYLAATTYGGYSSVLNPDLFRTRGVTKVREFGDEISRSGGKGLLRQQKAKENHELGARLKEGKDVLSFEVYKFFWNKLNFMCRSKNTVYMRLDHIVTSAEGDSIAVQWRILVI